MYRFEAHGIQWETDRRADGAVTLRARRTIDDEWQLAMINGSRNEADEVDRVLLANDGASALGSVGLD